MNNKQLYKETFDIMQMSEESIRKVKDMSEMNEKTSSKRSKLKTSFRAAIAAAALVAVFALGNVAVYAATGSSLVDKVGQKISLYIDGKKTDTDRITKTTDENGNDHYEIELAENETSAGISFSENTPDPVETSWESEPGEITATLEKDGKKTYLVIGDNGKRLDITKDFDDGSAKGSFEHNEKTYLYKVSGTVDKYQIDVKQK